MIFGLKYNVCSCRDLTEKVIVNSFYDSKDNQNEESTRPGTKVMSYIKVVWIGLSKL